MAENMKKKAVYIILLLLISLAAFISFRHSLSEREDEEATANGQEYTEHFDQTDPRQVCDYFAEKVLHDPETVYQLFNKQYKNGTTLKNFVQFREYQLPSRKDVTLIEYVKEEHGFTEMPSGIESSEYTYRVKSKDDFQPSIKLTIDVSKEEDVYRILRYAVISE
ncbi:MAG: hypothetical protein J7K65_01625 [Planctomycetes bacterium]|nr:hypothetical protein [Planctomycetota bacterium]